MAKIVFGAETLEREHVIMGKPFVADKAREYLESFPIKRTG